nr:hypothetical protein [uncultured Holophaga sp.]
MASALEIAQSRLDAYLAAEARILAAGQEGTMATRRRRDAELAEIRSAISDLQAEVSGLQDTAAGRSRMITVVPR